VACKQETIRTKIIIIIIITIDNSQFNGKETKFAKNSYALLPNAHKRATFTGFVGIEISKNEMKQESIFDISLTLDEGSDNLFNYKKMEKTTTVQ
jgi:hypothetical protein